MKESARKEFVPFTSKFEGVCKHMYLDVKGLVTSGIGNLINDSDRASVLPFKRQDGSPASKSEIIEEWNYVKSRQDLRFRGGMIYQSITKLRLTNEGVLELVLGHLKSDEVWLRKYFPNYDEFPADAQLALHSMAWANGAAFSPGYPTFTKHAKVLNFRGCANECWIGPILPTKDTPVENRRPDPKNPGVHPRNLANYKLFQNADLVIRYKLDPDILYYPDSPKLTVVQSIHNAAIDTFNRK